MVDRSSTIALWLASVGVSALLGSYATLSHIERATNQQREEEAQMMVQVQAYRLPAGLYSVIDPSHSLPWKEIDTLDLRSNIDDTVYAQDVRSLRSLSSSYVLPTYTDVVSCSVPQDLERRVYFLPEGGWRFYSTDSEGSDIYTFLRTYENHHSIGLILKK